MEDGSMSAEEYLQRARELTVQMAALAQEQRELGARRRQSVLEEGNGAPLLSPLRDAVHGLFPTVTFDAKGRPTTVMRTNIGDDRDLVIHNVHNLPCRARPVPPAGTAYRITTDAMQWQMDTGAYPTLEDHRARTSPAFEPSLNDMGRFTAKRLTKEEEDAIRTRKNCPGV